MSDPAPPPSKYRLSIRRPVTVAMLFLSLLVFGAKSYQDLSINLMPDISCPTLTVRTEYEGAAPADVEELMTRPLEERLSVVNGVVEVSSISSAGLSEIILEFTWSTDMNVAMQDVRDALDMYTPPQGINKKPAILRYDPTLDPVLRVALTGRSHNSVRDRDERQRRILGDLIEIREAAERQVKADLEAEVGIAQVVVKGGREEEIQVLVDSARLKSFGLTLGNVLTSLQQQNINLSGGSIKEGKTEYLVRTLNEFQDVEEIEDVIIRVPSGDQHRLKDLAEVFLGEKERETIVRVNGREAVELQIFKEGSANTVEVCNTLKDFFGFSRRQGFLEKLARKAAEHMPTERAEEMLAEFERKAKLAEQLGTRLPEYHQATLITDQSRFIVASIKEVQQTAIIGGLLALFILYLFLREIRSTLIIGLAIPISVIATFVPMFARDVSLNIMSLGGLALGVGMLVDNSIVVLESIFRCKEEGDGILDAAERGTSEVSGAVTASTLTTIAVFFPIIFVEGIAGQLFGDLALTVTFSLIASLLVALYLIPMVASRQGAALSATESEVWLIRAYFEARGQSGTGKIAALKRLPLLGLGYAREALSQSWNETAGRALHPNESDSAAPSGALKLLLKLSVAPLAILFVVQLALEIVSTIFVTLLFAITLLVLTGIWVVSKILGVVFFLPAALFDYSFRALRVMYLSVLRKALVLSPLILAAVAVLAAHAAQTALGLGSELIPPLRQGEFNIRIEAPPGTRLEDTERRAQLVSNIVGSYEEVETVTMQVGVEEADARSEQGENIANLSVKLVDPERTSAIQDELIEAMRDEVIARMPDNITFTLPTLFSFKTAVELQIFGDELEVLRAIGEEALDSLQAIDGLKDVELSLKRGYPEIIITYDRDLLATLNLSPSEVAQLVKDEVQGNIATEFSRGAEKIGVRVRADQRRLSSLIDLKNLPITSGFPSTTLSAAATLHVQDGPSEIRRIDQRQVVLITANVEGRDLGSAARDIDERMATLALAWPPEYDYNLGGQQQELESSSGSMIFALLLAVFLIYVVMACQFESIYHPALIMFSVPLAFVGVVYALDWLGLSVSIVVFIGGIVLAGIIVNAAIILVDYINQLRARGLPKTEAIVEACGVRFRPILMTTLTTILGLLPMVLSTGEGAEMRRPMAITVMAGLASGTLLTLFIIPVVYKSFGGRDKA